MHHPTNIKSTELLLPYGLNKDNNTLTHISDAESGLACNCICPHCKTQLIARKGDIKQHHFAHNTRDTCEYAIESTFHMLAKDVLMRERKLFLPQYTMKLPSNHELTLCEAGVVEFDRVEEEKRVGGIIPDIVAYKNNVPLLIEVFVTHKIHDQKRIKIRKMGLSAIEINLPDHLRDHDYAKLHKDLIDGSRIKHWIFNRRAMLLWKKMLAKGENKTIRGGKYKQYVDLCPTNARTGKRDESYAEVQEDCMNCLFLLKCDSREIVCCGRNRGDRYRGV